MAAGDFPDPLTPADCDLRDFQFMPLEVQRLRRSKAWLICKRDPAMAFYMINLWSAAWHEVPAASLEDDDDVLADLAMCDPKKWDKVRSVVMRGWVKCSDGRLYHPIVAQKAMTAWEGKTAQRQRTQAAREARAQKRSTETTDAVTISVTDNATENVTESVTANVTSSKGKGEGKGENNTSSLRSDDTPPKPKRAKPRTQLSGDWEPTHDGHVYAEQRGINVYAELAAFKNHHQSKGNLMADWEAAWRTWCDNQVKWGKAPGKQAPVSSLFGVPAPSDDPAGIRAYIAKCRTDNASGIPMVNGFEVETIADQIVMAIHAAGGQMVGKPNWHPLADWLRDDLPLDGDRFLSTIRRVAISVDGPIRSMQLFDAALRSERVAA